MRLIPTLLLINSIAFANIDEMKIDFALLQEQIPNAIERIEEDRCFIQPAKVHLCEGLAFVDDEKGNLVSFPMICITPRGIYLPMGSKPSQARAVWFCKKCTLEHHYQPQVCERLGCGGTDFIVRYR